MWIIVWPNLPKCIKHGFSDTILFRNLQCLCFPGVSSGNYSASEFIVTMAPLDIISDSFLRHTFFSSPACLFIVPCHLHLSVFPDTLLSLPCPELHACFLLFTCKPPSSSACFLFPSSSLSASLPLLFPSFLFFI